MLSLSFLLKTEHDYDNKLLKRVVQSDGLYINTWWARGNRARGNDFHFFRKFYWWARGNGSKIQNFEKFSFSARGNFYLTWRINLINLEFIIFATWLDIF